MSLLNREADGSPNILVALFRALLAFGPMTDGKLVDLVAPETAIKQSATKKTLSRWKQLGFFAAGEGSVVELETRIKTIGIDDRMSFRTEVLRLVCQEKNNATLLQDDPDDELPSGSADLCRALSWALMQDPLIFPKSFDAAESLVGQQGVMPRPFKNNTRWPSFIEWATFLGMAVNSGRSVTPNPALALAGFLDEIKGSSSEMPQGDFLDRACKLLPVLDGGTIRKRVAGTIATSWVVLTPSDLSPSLSAALLTLEAGRRIRLELRSDAPVRNLLGKGARQLRPFSHITFTGGGR